MEQLNLIPKLAPSARVSGGTPNGFPDYRPLNKLPKDEVAKRLKRILKPPLYQVWVEVKDRSSAIPIGPKCENSIAHMLAYEIRRQVALGNEQVWSNPTVVLSL